MEPERTVRVVRGTPTSEELAALVGVLLARGRTPWPAGPVSTRSHWVRSSRVGAIGTGLPPHRGAGAWRTSALPR